MRTSAGKLPTTTAPPPPPGMMYSRAPGAAKAALPPPGMMYSRSQGPSGPTPPPPPGMVYSQAGGSSSMQTQGPRFGQQQPFGRMPGQRPLNAPVGDPYGGRGGPAIMQRSSYSPIIHSLDNQRAGQSMGAYGSLGSSAMNSMGQYGSNVANSLANQSIAAGNTFGQMANAYYNTMGQLGHVGGALSAAGLSAGANSAFGSMGGSMGFGGDGGFGGGGYGGFDVSGPSGNVASGAMGGFGGSAGSMGGSGGYGASVSRGASPQERVGMTNQGFGFLGSLQRDLQNGHGGVLAGLAADQFNANRQATMDPRFMDSMNNTFRDSQAGIDSQAGLYRQNSGFGGMFGGMPAGLPRMRKPSLTPAATGGFAY